MKLGSFRSVMIAVLIAGPMILLLPSLAINANGSGSQAATFAKVEIEISPTVQGLGGEMIVVVTGHFYGGCCYSLFASDITPQLNIPSGLAVLEGPDPESVDSLTAIAGGEPTFTRFRWRLLCEEEGSYSIPISITTKDCGSRSASASVHVIKGASISPPDIFPEKPTTDKEVILRFTSSYPVGELDIIDARVHYFHFDRPLNLSSIVLERGAVIDEGSEIGEADLVSCVPDPTAEGGFTATIPKGEGTYLYFWIDVEDENGNHTISSPYKVRVEDVGAVSLFNLVSLGFLTGSFIALVLFLCLVQNRSRRQRERIEEKDRFNVLGPIGRKRYLTEVEGSSHTIKKDRKWVHLAVFIIACLMILTAVVMVLLGYASTFFDQLLDPSGGIWRC